MTKAGKLALAFIWVAGVVSFSSPHIAYSASCDAIVGKWAWFAGGEVTINADRTFTQKSGNSGTWNCADASKGAVTW